MTDKIVYHRPSLKPYQVSALFCPERYAFIEGTTKSGKTFGGMAWLLEQALLGKVMNYWWVAPVYSQAHIAYARLKLNIPDDIRKSNDTDMNLTFSNGHILWCKSAEKPDSLYGEDVGAILIDEASRTREESYYACRSTLTATRGPLRAIGNVKGKRNWFYNMARKAEAGEPDMHHAKITCLDAIDSGILDAAEIEDAKRHMPEAVFNELYMAIPTEDGANPFGMQHIAACIGAISLHPAVCYGVDLAKSVDWTVIIGLDILGKVCHFERFQKPWTETKARIREVCGETPTLCDSTGVGDPVVEDLQRGEYIGMQDFQPNFDGYKFSRPSKQQIMEGLAVSVQQGRTTILEGPHRLEMESFEYVYTRTGVSYSAPEGMHDDCVCAHALAVSVYREAIDRQPSDRKPLDIAPVRTGSPVDPRISKPPERNFPTFSSPKTKGLNINPVRLGGPADQRR